MTATRRTAFTTTMGVIDRVHGNAANMRTLAEPTRAARLAMVDVAMIRVRHRTDRGKAARRNEALFARTQAQNSHRRVAADQLRVGAERAIWPPFSGFISTLWMMVPTGMAESGIALPGFTSTPDRPETTLSPAARRCGARM